MSRPMLLSFIDDLLEIRRVEKMRIAETYKIIIDQWLIRECKTQIDSEYKLKTYNVEISNDKVLIDI